MAFTSSRRGSGRGSGKRERTPPPPLDAPALEALALTYVARFATSTGKLSDYLKRKLRERGWDQEAPPADIAAVVALRLAERGYVNDAGYAQAQGEGLRRRGYGAAADRHGAESCRASPRRCGLLHAGARPSAAMPRWRSRGASGCGRLRRSAVLIRPHGKSRWQPSCAPGTGLTMCARVMNAHSLEDAEEWAE